jgi:hypothetical protein
MLAIVQAAAAARAQPADPGLLAAVADADPLELARHIDSHGDAIVVRGLHAEQPGQVRLAAVRAVPFMNAPWNVLQVLGEMLVGRDSELAPAAARSLLKVAERGDANSGFALELGADQLDKAIDALDRAASDRSVRADIALAAGQASSMLTAAVRAHRSPTPAE